MNDEKIDGLITVTIQWYKSNVVRLIFNGRTIWETKDIALDTVERDTAGTAKAAFEETTLRLDLLEATNYMQILYRGLQVGRLEKIDALVQLRVQQWEFRIALFEMQLKQRMVNMGFASLLKAIDPSEPSSNVDDGGEPCMYALDDEPCNYTPDDSECGNTCDGCFDTCDGMCDDCALEGSCDKIDIDDIESDDDTLHLCKGCDATRNSCAGCPDADPNDRYMNDGDVDMRANIERARLNGGVGLADNDSIYQR